MKLAEHLRRRAAARRSGRLFRLFLPLLPLLLPGTAALAFDDRLLAATALQEERTLEGRLGVAVLDTANGQTWAHRGNERFPMSSTHKAFLCGAVLDLAAQGAARGELSLDREVPVDRAKLVPYSPATGTVPPGGTISLGALCDAAIRYSDNTASNLLVAAIGGPPAFNAFLRSIGDRETRLDRAEPDLNEATPGDPRDPTAPLAAARSLGQLLLGNRLPPPARATLMQWMADDQVAGTLLRAGLPQGWWIADKSGAGGHGSRSILAAIRPPGRPPGKSMLLVAIYVTETAAPREAADAAIARIGAVLAQAVAQTPDQTPEPGGAPQPVPLPPPSR